MEKDKKINKIVLASSIFPPSIGGPATYAFNLQAGLKKQGMEVRVVSYHDLDEHGVLKFWLYLRKLWKVAKESDLIYSFNLVSTGLPACLVSFVLRKKLVIRIGGDYLWERAIEKKKIDISLREYYDQPKSLIENILIFLQKQVLKNANKIIFTTEFQKQLYIKHFKVKEEKIVIIDNPFPILNMPEVSGIADKKQILFAGRLIRIKNLNKLIKAFNNVLKQTNKPMLLKIIGQGSEKKNLQNLSKALGIDKQVIFQDSIPHQNLMQEIQSSYLCILPSLSEVSPNFALECIALQKPILLTKEVGFYEQFKNNLIFIDPQSESDIAEQILALLDENNYQNYLTKIKNISTNWDWDSILQKHIKLFQSL